MGVSTQRSDTQQLKDILRSNPEDGIKTIARVYEARVDKLYPEGQAYLSQIGGPVESAYAPLYDAIGEVYHQMKPQHKSAVLTEIYRGPLGGLNYLDAQLHVEKMRAPELEADLITVVPIYWPGLQEGKSLVTKYSTFEILSSKTLNSDGLFKQEKVDSDFLVSYALLRSDIGELRNPYRDRYYDFLSEANRPFLDRVFAAIVELRFGLNPTEEAIEKGTKRLRELLPKPLHDRIDAVRKGMDLSYLAPLRKIF